jgi:putative peptide zinc metalloprotease protein
VPDSLFSGSWYRVKDLVPRLRAHARIHRQRYRGETWYVLQDASNERFHRFTPAAHAVIGVLDGTRSIEEIWQIAADRLGDEAPTQDEMIQLFGQLHAADLLQSDVPPDVLELFERNQRYEHQQLRSRLVSPFAIRIHLLDPEKFLTAATPYLGPLFGWLGALLWLGVVIPAAVLAGVHWSELTEGVLDRLFTSGNLLAVWLIFPLLKLLHEFGHGFAAKHFGGQVHDMGIMFLVFAPVPYVDASSSWAFDSKVQRALVGAGGMLVELFVASLALYVWLGAEPGAVRAAAYNALLIGGVTTLLFNANPLLRFDGYYILSDLLEIPNLRARGSRFVAWLTERYLFGNGELQRPHTAPGESGWLVGFTVAAFAYRILIVVAILSWILDQFFFVGVVLGLVAGIGWVVVPLYKGLRFLFTSASIRRVRGRAIAVCAGGLALVAGVLVLVPVPLRTQVEGVVWVPQEALVRAGSEGFVAEVVAVPGARVERGDVLIQLQDPELETRRISLEARVRELEARVATLRAADIFEAQVSQDELDYARKSLARVEERSSDLVLRAGDTGTFVLVRPKDLPGRFVRQGELLAHVVDLDTIVVRAVIGQDDVRLVRRRLAGTEVRLAERLAEVHRAEVVRIVPAASEKLPSRVLGSGGGGEVPVDPRDPAGQRAIEKMFEVELELPATGALVNAGGRVYVRFDLGSEPLGVQWGRRLRQLFLSRFQV